MNTTHEEPAQAVARPEWLPTDVYPFHLRGIELPSGQVTYVDEGEGPVLLFVHAGMWSFIFRDVITRLTDRYRCITLDFPGFGLSPGGSDEQTLPALSRTLGEFVTALGLDDVTVVAHDLGGLTALGWAAGEPERVRGFVMANTFTWTPDGIGLRAMLSLMSSRTITALGAATNFVPRITSTWFGVGRHLDHRERAAFLGPFKDPAKRRRFHRLMRSALDETEYTARVDTAITAELHDRPILTIFGERNDMFGFQRRHEARFPNHRSLIIEKGNHFPMMDAPDLFAETVSEWWGSEIAETL